MKNNMRINIQSVAMLLICFLSTLVCVITGNYIDKGYAIEVGSVSTARIVAPRQIENTYATVKKRADAASGVAPLFKLDQSVSDDVTNNIISIFEYLEERRDALERTEGLDNENSINDAVSDTNTEIPGTENDTPAIDTEQYTEPPEIIDSIASPIIISEGQLKAYSDLPRATRIEMRDILVSIAGTIMESGIKEEADTKSLLYVRDELNKKSWSPEMVSLGYGIVTSALEPNIVIDDEATAAATEAKVQQVQPIIVLEGQKIVDEGEIVTEDAYWLLSAFDLLQEKNNRSIYEIVGASAIILLIFAVFLIYVRFFYKSLLSSVKEIALLCILYVVAIVMFRLMSSVTFYIIPLTIPVILIAVLIDQRLAVFVNILLVFLCALIYKGSFEFMIFFVVTGSVSVLVSRFTFERTKIVIAGLIICIINFLVVAAINAFYYKSIETGLMFNSVIAVSNGLLSLLIAIGSLPIWEAIFDVITPVKLLDLTNPNNVLLRRLTIEAPGTYHHSLIVANLAEQAAYDIGANAPLARVGGYYHDIGKLKYPYYFGENQVGENPHDHFDPYDSARLIMRHVPLGLEFADNYKLPRIIKDIILQHHGTTLVKFFFCKAQEVYSVDYVKESDFRYTGVIPRSKEAAIVMLADTAEAAVRSMAASSKSIDEVEAFLKMLIKSKLDDSQLDDCMLTMSELSAIRKSFVKVFRGLYHERVKYPGENNSPAETKKQKE